ncbi:MAG: hypothetical protein OXH66_08840 [Gemmatimonadetes bacterium]|nr:hypothetical protein [Gemmatimonadota bacterium]
MSAKRVSGVVGLPPGIVVETPATMRGSRYAWVPATAHRELEAGPFKLLVLLCSLHRKRKPIELTARECAESLGCCERSLRNWRRALEASGWVKPGLLCIHRPERLREGSRARVDVTKLANCSPASLRAYVAVLLDTRDGKRRRTFEAIAKSIGRSRQALWAALTPVRIMGMAVADRVSGAVRAVGQVTSSMARGRGPRVRAPGKRTAARLSRHRPPST